MAVFIRWLVCLDRKKQPVRPFRFFMLWLSLTLSIICWLMKINKGYARTEPVSSKCCMTTSVGKSDGNIQSLCTRLAVIGLRHSFMHTKHDSRVRQILHSFPPLHNHTCGCQIVQVFLVTVNDSTSTYFEAYCALRFLEWLFQPHISDQFVFENPLPEAVGPDTSPIILWGFLREMWDSPGS